MTISSAAKGTNRRRPLVLLVIAFVALGLAGFTAHSALAQTSSRSHFLTSERSLEVLRTAYGAVAERPITEGRVAVVPTSAAISALSDQVNISNGAYNARTGRIWAQGDTEAAWPLGIRGFTDVKTGDVYINAEFAMETTTPHEMLHSSVNPDFAKTMGLSLYEGATEQLALEALRISHLASPETPEYPKERALVAELVRVADPQLLARAYLNGGTALAELVRAIGPDTLAKVKGDAASGNLGGALAALQAVGAAR